MEVKINCFLMLPLREMALKRIAVVLAQKPESLAAIQQFSILPFCDQWWTGLIWREVKYTISKVLLPKSMKKELVPILRAIASEILNWKSIHCKYLGEINEHVVGELCWNSAGAIDYPKTCERLLSSDALDNVQRFKLACLYCREDSIPSLWNEMSWLEKRRICKGADPPEVDTPSLQLFLPFLYGKHERVGWGWPRLGNIRSECLQNEYALCNKAANYYLNSLSEEERKLALSVSGVDALYFMNGEESRSPNVLSFLLSLMTCEQQFNFLKKRPCEVLACFLYWPWQELYLDIADIVWTFLDEFQFLYLLEDYKYHIVSSGYYLPNFIQDFFLRSPLKFRKYFLDEECQSVFFFEAFFIQEDYESMRVIFGNINVVDKERLLFSRKFLKLFHEYRLKDQWHVVEECIKEAELSEEDKDRLKEAFEEFLTEIDVPEDEYESDDSDTDVSELEEE